MKISLSGRCLKHFIVPALAAAVAVAVLMVLGRESSAQNDPRLAAFRKDPAPYIAPASKPKAMESPRSERPAKNALLTVMVKTTCAGCEHGVAPIENPEELGLAVNTDDGKVVIVEQAHKLYRNAYENRYNGQQVRVSGHVIKRRGRFTWLDPTELMVLQ